MEFNLTWNLPFKWFRKTMRSGKGLVVRQCRILPHLFLFFLSFFFFQDISTFCGTSDTPVLDFWWCLSWVSKPRWIPFVCFLACAILRFTFPLTPADCRGQHSSRTFLIHILTDVSASIGGGSGQGSNPRPSVQRAQRSPVDLKTLNKIQ